MASRPRLVNIFLLVGLLVGCGTLNPASNSTAISSPSLMVTREATRLPTATRRPSVTPSPSPTIDLTKTVIYQDALTTQSLEQTLMAQYPHACEASYGNREFSPNGLWLMEFCYSENDQDFILTLSNKDSQVLWKVFFLDTIPTMDPIPDGWLSVVHWSEDGRYAYFYSDLGGSGGECFYQSRERGPGVFRLDLQSGQTTAILPPNNNFWWYGFSFSPTDRRLVYGALSRDLKILDLTTGKIIEITTGENHYETGGYLWSSDGLKLVYSLLIRNELGEGESVSLRLVDAQSGDERILLDSPDNCFSALSWATNSTLIIERQGRDGNAIIEFDLNTNSVVSESTATPFP